MFPPRPPAPSFHCPHCLSACCHLFPSAAWMTMLHVHSLWWKGSSTSLYHFYNQGTKKTFKYDFCLQFIVHKPHKYCCFFWCENNENEWKHAGELYIYCIIPHVLMCIDSYIICVGVQRILFMYGYFFHGTHGNHSCVFLRLWGTPADIVKQRY